MISNITKGSGFGGALGYVEGKEGAQIVMTNCAGTTTAERAREMRAIAQQNPRCTRPVMHVSLSAAPGERLTDKQWKQVAGDYMRAMGFRDCQYVVVRHTDRSHDHAHVIANRVRETDFIVVSDKNDRHRTQTVLRQIEQRHGLQIVEKQPRQAGKTATPARPLRGRVAGVVGAGVSAHVRSIAGQQYAFDEQNAARARAGEYEA